MATMNDTTTLTSAQVESLLNLHALAELALKMGCALTLVPVDAHTVGLSVHNLTTAQAEALGRESFAGQHARLLAPIVQQPPGALPVLIGQLASNTLTQICDSLPTDA